jgi:hypothetical protein
LGLRSRSRFGLRGWAGLRSWPFHWLWTGLWGWLRSGAVLRLRLTILRLLWAELRLLRPWLRLLRLDRACLRLDRTSLRLLWLNGSNLRLVRAIVRLYRTNLRLLWLNRTNLRLVGAVVRLDRADLRLFWLNRPHLGLVGTVIRLYGPDLRLAGSYLRLTGLNWLDLWPVVWLARTESLLATGATLGLARTPRIRSGVGARDTGLGGDGPRSCDHSRAAAIHVVELLTVLLRFALVLELGRHGRSSGPAHGFDFRGPRSVDDAAPAPVVRDAGVVVDDDGAVVDVGDAGADPIDGAVVVEGVAIPIAAVIADAGVAKAVIDAAIETDVTAPVAAMKAPAIAVPAPVAGGPESTVVGRGAPCAGNPVVARGRPTPVAGGPNVVGLGGFRLIVDGQGRRRLVGIFDGSGFAFLVELLGGLRVLQSLVLIRRGWSGLLRRILLGWILLGALLRLGLVANSEDGCPRGGSRD